MKDKKWMLLQYRKIQDYVVKNKLFLDQPDDISHADIIINEIERLVKNASQPSGPPDEADADTCSCPTEWRSIHGICELCGMRY